MSEDRVRIEVANHVAVVTLNRPDKHNALDLAMFDALTDAIERLRGTPALRAVVLHGEGKSFCSGLDFMSVMGSDQITKTAADPLAGPFPNYFQKPAYGWMTLAVPVVAAIHGNCLGGGLQIALGADIRISAPDAKLSVMESKWGLVPDMSITRSLPRLVGIDVAKELTYTARVFSGEEALSLGVVTRVSDDPLTDAKLLADRIAGQSPDAIRRAKQLFEESWTAAPQETLSLEAKLQSEVLGTPNQIAAVTAGLTKEPAQFTDPT